MADNESFMKFMAAWALVHETADEGWKAAVIRGAGQETGEMNAGPQAFVDGLSSMIAIEKEKLKAELAAGEVAPAGMAASVTAQMDELRFEVGELRGAVESLKASVDALARLAQKDGAAQ